MPLSTQSLSRQADRQISFSAGEDPVAAYGAAQAEAATPEPVVAEEKPTKRRAKSKAKAKKA